MSTWGGGRDAPKEPCPACGKLIDPRGRRDHRIAKHGARPRKRSTVWQDPVEPGDPYLSSAAAGPQTTREKRL